MAGRVPFARVGARVCLVDGVGLFRSFSRGACDCGDGGGSPELQPKPIAPERVDFGDVGLGIEVGAGLRLEERRRGRAEIQSKNLDASLEDFRIGDVIPTRVCAKQEVEVRLRSRRSSWARARRR